MCLLLFINIDQAVHVFIYDISSWSSCHGAVVISVFLTGGKEERMCVGGVMPVVLVSSCGGNNRNPCRRKGRADVRGRCDARGRCVIVRW